jgi:hypothetical protein
MTKYRVVVNAAQTWKSSFGDEYRGVAERCVHLEALNTAEADRKAEGVMSAIYPEVNTFHPYDTVSELDDSDEVLRIVIGWAKGR